MCNFLHDHWSYLYYKICGSNTFHVPMDVNNVRVSNYLMQFSIFISINTQLLCVSRTFSWPGQRAYTFIPAPYFIENVINVGMWAVFSLFSRILAISSFLSYFRGDILFYNAWWYLFLLDVHCVLVLNYPILGSCWDWCFIPASPGTENIITIGT